MGLAYRPFEPIKPIGASSLKIGLKIPIAGMLKISSFNIKTLIETLWRGGCFKLFLGKEAFNWLFKRATPHRVCKIRHRLVLLSLEGL